MFASVCGLIMAKMVSDPDLQEVVGGLRQVLRTQHRYSAEQCVLTCRAVTLAHRSFKYLKLNFFVAFCVPMGVACSLWCLFGGRRTTFRGLFSPSIMGLFGTKLLLFDSGSLYSLSHVASQE